LKDAFTLFHVLLQTINNYSQLRPYLSGENDCDTENEEVIMKKRGKTLIPIIVLGLILTGYNLFAQTAEELLPKAIQQEEVKGELYEAIKTYQLILDNYPGNREICAEALLRMGMCYEKLGKHDAMKAYREVISTYSDQKDIVARARERLSKLLVAEKVLATTIAPKFTKIKIPTKLWLYVALSPNGKDLALVSDDKLWKMPVTGNLGPEYPGIPVHINTGDIKLEASCISWSGDGKWIAFNDIGQSNENFPKIPNQSIYRIPSNGGKPYEILNNYRGSAYLNYRINLSPDGENLAYSSVENNEQHIYTTQVTGSSPKQLVDIQAREPVYSPNGKWIAYVEDKNLGKDGGDLWVIPAAGGVPKLVAEAGKASNPVWSPDSKMIAFLDLNKQKQITLVRLQQDGETMGKIYSIDAPAGIENLAVLAGWTPENKIGILATTKREFALFTLPPKGGQAAMVLKDDSWIYQPRWSRDGKQIYYTTAPGMGIEQGLKLRLASVSAIGGSGELFTLLITNDGDTIRTITYQGGNRISPDGKMLISSAWTSKDQNPSNPYFPNLKIWKFSLDGNERVQLTNKSDNYADFCPCWSPNGEKVAFIRSRMAKGSFFLNYDEAGIYIIDSSGNESQILPYSDDKFFFSLSWSPDGKMLAYLTIEKEAPKKSYMNIIHLETGESKVIRELPTVHQYMELAWSPDSRQIAFNGEEIQVVNIDDGSTENIESSLKDVIIFDIDWSPDGKYFVFGGLIMPKSEFWFLEDFLPQFQNKN
jgi:Tol biopolymer transport system component